MEDEKLRDVCNQKGRIECADIRTASKKLAVDSGTFNKHLSQDGLAFLKHKYFAWRKTHPSMQSFYVKLCAENHECLIGYDAKRLSRIVETHKFSSLKEDDDSGDQEGEDIKESEDEQMDDAENEDEQMDDAEDETSATILESGMIEDKVMPPLSTIPSAAVTSHSNGYAHISVVEI